MDNSAAVEGNWVKSASGGAQSRRACALLILALTLAPAVSAADIVWNGDFSPGNFMQYHHHDTAKEVYFQSVPPYGRPRSADNLPSGTVYKQTGNGELLSIVTAPTRGGPYSAKFTLKSRANEIIPDDCDPRGGGNCNRRRNNLWMQRAHARYYDALPHMGERWVSWSIYLEKDWPNSGSGFGNVFSIKQEPDSYAGSGYFRMQIENDSWSVKHQWNPEANPTEQPWQYGMFYTARNSDGKPYPRSDNWPDGLKDFPDATASVAALGSLNKGGWTDWIMHYRQDHRGAAAGGKGFLTLWKREDSGPWTKVLHILPKKTTRGGMTFDHGIGYNLSAATHKGAGVNAGFYMDERQVHDTVDRVFYLANIKIGDARTTFQQMSHDGSSPDSKAPTEDAPPKPPAVQVD